MGAAAVCPHTQLGGRWSTGTPCPEVQHKPGTLCPGVQHKPALLRGTPCESLWKCHCPSAKEPEDWRLQMLFLGEASLLPCRRSRVTPPVWKPQSKGPQARCSPPVVQTQGRVISAALTAQQQGQRGHQSSSSASWFPSLCICFKTCSFHEVKAKCQPSPERLLV